ncbi:cbb3-type cytochrome c oxidase subunit I, partial [Microlunatus capsulatus]
LSDSYFVVAHFHYVVFGTVVFAMFAGFYFWWPKFTGRMLDETLGKVHFWLLFIGFHVTFLVQHWLGVEGMPRRYADYLPNEGFTVLNQVSSAGAFLLGASMIPFFWNVWKSRNAPLVNNDDPWGWGRSLEWATSSPPPRHNFTSIPRIRSESPAFDLHHPEVALSEYEGTNGRMFEDSTVDSPDDTGRAEELKARVDGTSDDPTTHYERDHPSQSPRPEEGRQ